MNKYHVGDWVRVNDGFIAETDCSAAVNWKKSFVERKLTVCDFDPSDMTYCCITPLGLQWFKEENLVPWAEPVHIPPTTHGVPIVRPLWDTTEALHELIALMSKYGITTYNIEQSEGLMTFTFTKEV